MTRRRAFLLGALVLVVGVLAVWFGVRDRSHPRQASAPARVHDEAASRRLAAIRHASEKLAPALPRYQLRGRVVDPAGSPVAGAAVVGGGQQTTSGTRGEFALTNLVPGRYAVEARKGPLVGGPLAVQLAGDREVTLVLRRGAELRVEVVSAIDKKPIANAEVHISLLAMYDDAGEQRGRTDASGVATFAGVTLVAHTIWVAAEGYAEQYEAVDPMHVVGTSLTFRMELSPGVMVRGRVVDADTGQPIANASIEAVAGDHREAARRGDDRDRLGNAPSFAMELQGKGLRTDSDGRFRIGVAKGPWTIVASHPRYATTGGFMTVTDAPLELQISMSKGIVVHGLVVTDSDLPVAGAEIEARWQHGGRVERKTRADGRGHFELAGLPGAPMELIARGADGTSSPLRLDLSQALPDEDVLLVLENTGVITGHVVRAGQPLAGAQVLFVEQNPRAKLHPGIVNCDETGAFRVAGLARDRTYVISAMPHQDGDAWFRSAGTSAKAGDDVTIEIPADGSLRGRVVVKGASVADVQVEIPGNEPPRAVGRDGSFSFVHIPPGRRMLLFTGARIAERQVIAELHPGENLDLGVITLDSGRVVAGKVIDAKQQPVADAELVVHVQDGSELRSPVTPDGTFSIVAPVDRALDIEARGRRGGFARLAVAATGPSTGLVIRIAGGATVEGAITVGDEPVKGAFVELRVGKTERPYSYTETDAAGYYKFQATEPGTYDLVITRPDRDKLDATKYTQPLNVTAGANFANVDLAKLAPRGGSGSAAP